MRWKFCDTGAISIKNHEIEMLYLQSKETIERYVYFQLKERETWMLFLFSLQGNPSTPANSESPLLGLFGTDARVGIGILDFLNFKSHDPLAATLIVVKETKLPDETFTTRVTH